MRAWALGGNSRKSLRFGGKKSGEETQQIVESIQGWATETEGLASSLALPPTSWLVGVRAFPFTEPELTHSP